MKLRGIWNKWDKETRFAAFIFGVGMLLTIIYFVVGSLI